MKWRMEYFRGFGLLDKINTEEVWKCVLATDHNYLIVYKFYNELI